MYMVIDNMLYLRAFSTSQERSASSIVQVEYILNRPQYDSMLIANKTTNSKVEIHSVQKVINKVTFTINTDPTTESISGSESESGSDSGLEFGLEPGSVSASESMSESGFKSGYVSGSERVVTGRFVVLHNPIGKFYMFYFSVFTLYGFTYTCMYIYIHIFIYIYIYICIYIYIFINIHI
jgi:hypothetical protein